MAGHHQCHYHQEIQEEVIPMAGHHLEKIHMLEDHRHHHHPIITGVDLHQEEVIRMAGHHQCHYHQEIQEEVIPMAGHHLGKIHMLEGHHHHHPIITGVDLHQEEVIRMAEHHLGKIHMLEGHRQHPMNLSIFRLEEKIIARLARKRVKKESKSEVKFPYFENRCSLPSFVIPILRDVPKLTKRSPKNSEQIIVIFIRQTNL